VRIWDLPAGYLNRQSLLGEHRELHGLYNILIEGKTGYSRHPETLRWVGAVDAVCLRHACEVAEMTLRGYVDRTPLPPAHRNVGWPATFVDEPGDQFRILRKKYSGRSQGRIPLPRNPQELWSQHKYSVLARDPDSYRRIGRAVARMGPRAPIDELARTLVLTLRERPGPGRLVNALEHMWGHVNEGASPPGKVAADGPAALLSRIQVLAAARRERFLLASTALSELAVYA
jgi:hypothetical protein